MNTFIRIKSQPLVQQFAVLAVLLFSALPASAVLTDLADSPLVNDAGSVVRPNLMFILDNSGSMNFNFTPDNVAYNPAFNIGTDTANRTRVCRSHHRDTAANLTFCGGVRIDNNAPSDGGDPPFYSPQFNTSYYNPEIRYLPPVNPCSPADNLPSMTDGSAVRVQGHQLDANCTQTSATVNLLSNYPERVYCSSSNSGVTGTNCKRNGIDVPATSRNHSGDYDFPDKTVSSNWYSSTDATHPYARTRNSNPHYFLIIPREYCSDSNLINCALQTAPTNQKPVPAYVRYCNTDSNASSTSVVSDNSNSNNPKCQAKFDKDSHTYVRYGDFLRKDIVSSIDSYPKGLGRTDCTGASCTYANEITNFSNWYAYYRTRMQTMKSAAGQAFSTIDDAFRVGFVTINPGNPVSSDHYLKIDDFSAPHKVNWYKKFYAIGGSGGTPLREALSRVGRHFANVTGGINSGMSEDPIEYECQQNFALLTTDGYWNLNKGQQIDGTVIGNQDNTDSGYSTRAVGAFDGGLAGSNDTLADVAMYYYKTDLRSGLANAVPATDKDTAKHQHMNTFTLGLGLDGELTYRADYETALTGDFADIKAGDENWPEPIMSEPTTLDDLWHAAVNGRGVYFSAKDPNSLTAGVQGALGGVTVKLGASAASATSSPNITPSDNFIYSSTYRTKFWDGEVVAKTIDTQTGIVSDAAVWSAQSQLDAKGDARTIYKMDSGGSLTEQFVWASLDSTEQGYFNNKCSLLSQCSNLDDATKIIANDGQSLLAFLRGNRQHENAGDIPTVDKAFRFREHILGDTVNAVPAFVKAPRFNFTDDGYSTFKTNNANRQGMLYIAANDGMLHALNASTGAEVWAYVPRLVMPDLHKLADKNYAAKHRFFVDGSPQTMDVKIGGTWKTILVGGLNGGGRGYYALDITSPTSPTVLWEFCNDSAYCSVSDADLGYTYGNPVIAKTPAGSWVVMVTSGYNNVAPGSGQGYLYMLNPSTGAVLQKISTGVGTPYVSESDLGDPSGLAKISAWADNADLDATATYVYGGDLKGNLWRFNLATNTVSTLATLKDPNGNPQPITTKPELGMVKNVPDRIVFVGTGSYLGSTDLESSQKQSIYAIRDTGSTITNARTVLTPRTISQSDGSATISGGDMDWANGGWYADLPESKERIHIDPQLVLGTLLVATSTPAGNSCSVGGTSWLYQFDFSTGLNVIGTSVLGKKSSTGLIVGVVVFRLPTGQLKGVSTSGDGTQETFGVNTNPSASGAKRTGWRELTK